MNKAGMGMGQPQVIEVKFFDLHLEKVQEVLDTLRQVNELLLATNCRLFGGQDEASTGIGSLAAPVNHPGDYLGATCGEVLARNRDLQQAADDLLVEARRLSRVG